MILPCWIIPKYDASAQERAALRKAIATFGEAIRTEHGFVLSDDHLTPADPADGRYITLTIFAERERVESLLQTLLPRGVVQQLVINGQAIAQE